MEHLSDLECLEIELATLWAPPHAPPEPYVVVARNDDGRLLRIGASVPASLARDIAALFDAHAPTSEYRRVVGDRIGGVVEEQGPSYVADGPVRFDSGAAIETSTENGAEALRGRIPSEDLEHTFAPWAVAVVDGVVAAKCSTARLSEHGAEAGVYTYPGYRGHGHAAAVTAAWVSLLVPTGRLCFYSTSDDNVSSQRVAARLGLRPIGSIWHLDPMR